MYFFDSRQRTKWKKYMYIILLFQNHLPLRSSGLKTLKTFFLIINTITHRLAVTHTHPMRGYRGFWG